MLVLSRKESEELVISDRIRIRVLRISGGTIRLGIEAPKDVSVRRAELAARETSESTTVEEVVELAGVI
jgi:carbon storage regulator